MEADPDIEIFDISSYAGMEYYAADSAGRLAPLYRRWAAAAETERERESCLRDAQVHEELARKYRLADQLVEEIKQALLEEDACPSS